MSSGMTERRLVFRDDCFARGLFFGRSDDNGRNTGKSVGAEVPKGSLVQRVVLRAANQNYHDCRWQSYHNVLLAKIFDF